MVSDKNDPIPTADSIAIIGMSCRFPGGANSPEEYWNILMSGIDVIGDIPPSRWDKLEYYDPDGTKPGKMHTMRGGFMNVPIDRFDPSFFNISPKEATSMDPQQRILLELSWEALEDAGINPKTIRGGNVGVFIGVSSIDYADVSIHDNIDNVNSYSLTGSCQSALAGRISFILGLEGPCMSIDTACSSSLVSIDSACTYLRLRKTGMALAGGFNLMLNPDMQICLTKLQALSPDGLCRSFDAEANGYVRSEGGGLVVLKRLEDALAAGDRVLAVIRGSCVNQDGQSTGISAPNGKSQERVIQTALRDAGVSGDQIDYIETHGTGTPVGDKTEITAIGNVMRPARNHASPVLVGSVKSNIGHLEPASGIAGLQKVILSLKHEIIPGNLHFATPNPNIEWGKLPVQVVSKNTPWIRNGKPRLAGINSYGFVGTNCHLILEEAPVAIEDRSVSTRPFYTLLISARNPEALTSLIRRYINFFKNADEERIADICHTAATGRFHFEFRAAVHGRDFADFVDGLTELLENDSFTRAGKKQRIVFLYTGQGSQYYGMGRQLYHTQPVFRSALDLCEKICREIEDTSLLEIIYAEGADPEKVNHTRYAQPLIFSIEYALTQLWLSWGIKPAATAGHSVGEYMAACLAGVIGIEDALRLVVIRARLMGSVPGKGRMVSISASREEVETLLGDKQGQATIAVLNSPEHTVIGGFDEAIHQIVEKLKARRIHHQILNVSHAFHSPQMDPVLDEFRKAFSGIELNEPQIPLISNTTATTAVAGQLTDPEYWVKHLRGVVRMSESLAFLDKEGYSIFLEIGPKPTILSFARKCIDNPRKVLACSMKHRVPDLLSLAESVGELYQAGINLDWDLYDRPFRARKVSLPTYPFSGHRYLVEKTARSMFLSGGGTSASAISPEYHPLIGQRIETGALPVAVLYQMEIACGAHHFFAEHVIMGVETAPAAALLSWVWLAARQVFPDEPFKMAEITLISPLILYDRNRIGQIIMRNVDAKRCAFEFVSREVEPDTESWITHCQGWIVRGELPLPESIVLPDLTEMESRCDFHISGKEFYDGMESLGYKYGSLFQGIKSAVSAANEMLCDFQSPARNAKTEGYWITPGDLDIIFQSPAVTLIRNSSSAPDAGKIYVPSFIKDIVLFRQLIPGRYRIYTRSQAKVEQSASSVESIMYLINERQQLCAAIEGFVSTAVSKQTLLREGRLKHLNRLTYEEEWKLQPRPATADQTARPKKTWIILGEQNESCTSLAQRLANYGRVCIVHYGVRFEELGQDCYCIDYERPDSYAVLFERLRLDSKDSVSVIHMLAAEYSAWRLTTADWIQKDVDEPLRHLLYLTQALLPVTFSIRLYIITAGCRPVKNEEYMAAMRNPGIDGFLCVAGLEHPEYRITHIDLSPFPEEGEIDCLTDELMADDAEMRVCLRRTERYVARLVHWRQQKTPENKKMPLAQKHYTLSIADSGVIDDMRLEGIIRREPGPQEVEFEVIASGLNFKDVLRALGEFKNTLNMIGGEAAGIVTRVGSQVKGFKPGDAIISHDPAGGGFSSHLTARQRFVLLKPEFLTFEEASTVSVSFMAAYYGLLELGNLQKGERVLIHAGAGGVGMAAVQLALDCGAEVFSTAGSPRKRALLREMGVTHVLNSRTLDFGNKIMELTGGKGVHLVLNSMTGDLLKQSLMSLADYGRFIELGKREILTLEQVHAVNSTVSYQSFDLADVLSSSPDGRKDIMDEILRKFARGSLRPPPVHVFPIQKANLAFRFMSQARHIGRIALSHREALRENDLKSETPLRNDGVYLITGGMGGLGMEIASLMASHQVGTIVLSGRRGPAGDTLAKIDAMKAAGADIRAIKCDISKKEDCARLFGQIDSLPHPLCGIIHAAGVLEDRTIAQQSWDRFAVALAPKVQGSWNLHLATKDRLLDFFVLFSSVASTIGNRGQSNYAAGNSFMNALAHYRRARGLCASSICWGPWAETGMAASGNQPGLRMAQQGILGIKPQEGIAAMFSIIQKDLAVPTVLDMNWVLFLNNIPEGMANTYLGKFKTGESRAGSSFVKNEEEEDAGIRVSPLQHIKEAASQERLPLVIALVRKMVGRVMGYNDGSMVPTDISLTGMGLDSLMVVDFRRLLEDRLSITLPFTLLVNQPTPEDIAAHILKNLK